MWALVSLLVAPGVHENIIFFIIPVFISGNSAVNQKGTRQTRVWSLIMDPRMSWTAQKKPEARSDAGAWWVWRESVLTTYSSSSSSSSLLKPPWSEPCCAFLPSRVSFCFALIRLHRAWFQPGLNWSVSAHSSHLRRLGEVHAAPAHPLHQGTAQSTQPTWSQASIIQGSFLYYLYNHS